MRRLALLTLILLFAARVAAQEVGNPQEGAAYAQHYCAKCHAMAGENKSPEPTAPRLRTSPIPLA